MAHNGFGLGEGGEIEAQMFNLAPKFIRIPKFKFYTNFAQMPHFYKTPVMRSPLFQSNHFCQAIVCLILFQI